MTTLNNKSWKEEFDSIVFYDDGLYQTESGWRITADPKKIKNFISNLLEQERKDERQKTIDECAAVILEKTGIPKGARNPTRDALVFLGEQLADKLNQLKEE